MSLPHVSSGDVVESEAWNNLVDAVNGGAKPGSGYTFGSGVAGFAPHVISTSSTVTDGRLNLVGFVNPGGFTANNMAFYQQTTGSSVTLFKLGIYTLDSSGNGTLVASTASQHTSINGSNGVKSFALSSAYAMVAGQSYAFALLSVGGTPPTVPCPVTTAFTAALGGLVQPFVYARLNSQTDLPSSFTYAGLTLQSFGFYMAATT